MLKDIGELFEKPGEMRYEWRISDFRSLTKEICVCYRSSKFLFSNACWCLEIWPNGGPYESPEGWVALFLCRIDSGPPKPLSYSLGFKKADGKEETSWSEYIWFSTEVVSYKPYSRVVSMSGKGKFLNLSELLNRKTDLAPLEVLTVTCTLESVDHQNVESSLFSRLWNLSLSFKDILDARKKTDVVVKLGDGEIPAHRIILESRSAVFNRMFDADMRETQTGEVNIEDVDEKTFKVVLSYLYSGKPTGLGSCNICEVYKAAHKYDLQELKKLCVDYMQVSLTVDTVTDVILFAKFYHETTLKECAKDYFAQHTTDVFQNANWKKIERENPSCIST